MRTEVKIGIAVGILLVAVVVGYIVFFGDRNKDAGNQADNRVATGGGNSSSGIFYDDNRPSNRAGDVWGAGNTANNANNNSGSLWPTPANTANNAANTGNNASNNGGGLWGNFTLNNAANNAGNNAGGNNAANNAGNNAPGSGETRTYTVKEGDSFWTIAAKPEVYGNGSLSTLLIEANKGVDARSLRVGTVLKVPPAPRKDPVPSGTGPDGTGPGLVTGGGSARVYTVAEGDTLWSIAKKTLGDGSKSALILKANPGMTSNIKPGQKINLPDGATVSTGTTTRPAGTTTRPTGGTTHHPSPTPTTTTPPSDRPIFHGGH